MTDETYNGWTNRATWCVSLHLNNDRNLYDMVQDKIQSYVDKSMTYEQAFDELYVFIDELVDELVYTAADKVGGLVSDLIGGVTRDINYGEIITAELEDYNERLAEASA